MKTHPVAPFVIDETVSLPADEAWRRLADLGRHTRFVPLTTIHGAPPLADLGAGDTFTARTSLGPIRVDDPMRVVTAQRPEEGGIGRLDVVKEGRIVTGDIHLVITPLGPGRSRVRWEQRIGVWPIPAALGPVVRTVARLAYRHVIRRLLRTQEQQ